MKTPLSQIAALAWLAITAATPSPAQSGGGFSLHWNSIDVGGGKCAGGTFALNGTIAQADASTASSSQSSLAGGFWPGTDLGETGPVLQILSSAGSVILSWPDSAAGFHLEHSDDLSRNQWLSNASPAFLFGTNKVVFEPAAGVRFYRLAKP